MIFVQNHQYIKAPDVVVQDLQGEAVLLNLANEFYYGLDEVGYRMYTLITTSSSLKAAYDVLLQEYDVEPASLQRDFEKLVKDLLDSGLIVRVNA